ncbi:vanadium-dependent haloperoxidase [Gillisia limnaea]|uniref:Phosphoesterase pa-phosphatase related protein n=1 Tax=Gillisia limnaea (strain DSM 15749 / LMG 21470 / R-8282) TaxID=865937 RepID=H2BWB0_GILLR|nr:vanadium-dependent haloperoxidase [Gillisia limnaea]EHQ04074.1 phosphoesterase pa-phosphatase related protein [Gillisia limnaea DSM 15749]
MNRFKFTLFFATLILFSCNKEEQYAEVSAEELHASVDQVTNIMVHDIFSPPVASRIYAYANVAAYEIVAQSSSNYNSLAGQLNGLDSIPKPKRTSHLNYRMSALIAHIEISQYLIFSEDKMIQYKDSLYSNWKKTNSQEFESSMAYATEVVDHIKSWMDKDNYKQTRTMPKFTVQSDNPERWQPTPPSYMDGIEPHWDKIRPFIMDTASQFRPIPPPEFSMEKGSKFHDELMEVYTIKNKMVEDGDESEELQIAQFWDCNPYVSVTRGHLMFATKKITPGGHWMGITKIASKKAAADFEESVYAYTKTSLAIADGFISCWEEKYRSNLVRPETLITKYIDENWAPVLQTPPFPEYSSGHSVISGAAAKALTHIFGENFSFSDDTEVIYGLPVREFQSFNHAAQEAAMSRMYGGIHYRSAVEVGMDQGAKLGDYLVNTLKMKNSKDPIAAN